MIKCLPLTYDLVNLKKQFYLKSQNATLNKFYMIINLKFLIFETLNTPIL